MKKFLTVLLALSVVFTYSFSAVGSVFAAEQYTLDDYSNALTAEKAAQLNYLASAKTQAVNSYTYDKDGFTTISGTKYMKAAVEAAADEVISDLTKEMDQAINEKLNEKDYPKSTAPDKTLVSNICKDETTAAGMKTALEAKPDTLNKVQAPLTKAFVEGKLDVDLSKYNSTDKKYDGLTAAQAVQKAIDEAKDAIKVADKEPTDAGKITKYNEAYTTFNTAMAGIKTIADEEYESGINAGTVDAAVDQLAKELLGYIEEDLKISSNMAADATVDWHNELTNWAIRAFWEADKSDAKKGELFGVAIADYNKVTRNEVAAVNAAYKAAVASAKAPIKAYADGDVSKVTALFGEKTKQYPILANAMAAADKYADVVALGEKMKATYEYGVKTYDDAKVDQAVKDAEALVYADLDKTFGTAESYIQAATETNSLDELKAENYELQKFNNAVEAAAKKMYSDGSKATTPAVKVVYGDNKTPEADFVYLKETYDATEAGADWAKIADKAVADLKKAQSYDEIDAIMAQAAEDFGKLLKTDDADAVNAARESYCKALENYGKLKSDLADASKFTDGNNNKLLDEFEAAVEQGKKLINAATTVADVEAAYAEGQKIIDSVKTADELAAAKTAVEKQISELPYTSKLTVADKAAVKAAYEAYNAYKNLPGAAEVANKALLQEKYNKVNELEAEAIEAKAKELNDKLAKLGNSDADIAAKAALKADVDAVNAEADALNDEIDAVNKDHTGFLAEANMPEADKLADKDMMAAVADDAYIKLVKAAKDGATVEEMEEALAAYNALTDKQKYSLDASALQFAKIIEKKLNDLNVNAVEGLKLTASSTAKKGSITVKWKVKGDSSVADGFQVYRSKKMNKGYGTKAFFTTDKNTKRTYKNTKSLKKGTRYYYKVRAYKVVDGKTYYSDWSNKAYRIAK